MIVSLPPDKFIAWTKDIVDSQTLGFVTKHELGILVGRLSHASTVLPLARFYLGRFYHKLGRFVNDFVRLQWNSSDKNFLSLWIQFLERAHKGISIVNMITFRRPTNIIISDACLDGIGGFSCKTGKAWRL